ncbi:MAG: hypothetical protein ACP5NL_01050 [Thermoplasmata archaeon]
MKSSTVMGAIIAIVLTLFALLLFYYLIISNTDKLVAGVYIGILALAFSLIGYILYAFIGTNTVLKSFVWGYYIFGFGTLFYANTVIKFSFPYLLILLLIFVISLVLIYWRLRSLESVKRSRGAK